MVKSSSVSLPISPAPITKTAGLSLALVRSLRKLEMFDFVVYDSLTICFLRAFNLPPSTDLTTKEST